MDGSTTLVSERLNGGKNVANKNANQMHAPSGGPPLPQRCDSACCVIRVDRPRTLPQPLLACNHISSTSVLTLPPPGSWDPLNHVPTGGKAAGA
jgi:hypothetical protein